MKFYRKSDYKKVRNERYASFNNGKGKEFEEGKLSLEALKDFCHNKRRAAHKKRQAGVSGKHNQPVYLTIRHKIKLHDEFLGQVE